jgi:hypothetical protein
LLDSATTLDSIAVLDSVLDSGTLEDTIWSGTEEVVTTLVDASLLAVGTSEETVDVGTTLLSSTAEVADTSDTVEDAATSELEGTGVELIWLPSADDALCTVDVGTISLELGRTSAEDEGTSLGRALEVGTMEL